MGTLDRVRGLVPDALREQRLVIRPDRPHVDLEPVR
jgi:hypothetical protein